MCLRKDVLSVTPAGTPNVKGREVWSMKIYTKSGDDGITGIIGGRRVRKSEPLVEALGAVDELSAWLGAIKGDVGRKEKREIEIIQKELQIIGAMIASEGKGCRHQEWVEKVNKDVERLEKLIDSLQEKLPKASAFVLPVGWIHVARTVCRRAERAVVALGQELLKPGVKYLNRLSDYLFILAEKKAARKNF